MDGGFAVLLAIAFIAINVFWLLRITVFSAKDQSQPKPEKQPASTAPVAPVSPPVAASKPAPPKLSLDAALSDSQVLAEIQAGRKINAIKQVRALTSAGLKESKEAVEAYMNDMPTTTTSQQSAATVVLSRQQALADPALRAHVKAGKKINAIKRYRKLTGAGLKESKEAVDTLFRT